MGAGGLELQAVTNVIVNSAVKKAVNRINEMIQELKAGRIDAILMEDTVAKGYIASNPDLEMNVLPNQEEAGSAIAFPKGSELLGQFDPIISEMKSNGELEKLIVKWFGSDTPAS